MKSGDVLKITGISRRHLSSLVKQGKLRVTVKPSGQYDYNPDDVYQYIGKVRQNLNKVDKVFSAIASGINFEKRKQFFTLLDLVIEGKFLRFL